MSHVMKVNYYYFLSAYCALRLGLNSVNLLFLILVIKLKGRVSENTKESVQVYCETEEQQHWAKKLRLEQRR